MKPTTKTLIGAAAVLSAGPALATPPAEPAVPAAASYADLLQPIPNALERLQAAESEAPAPQLIEAQYTGPGPMAHHHHHHHHHSRHWYRSHGYVWMGGTWVIRPSHHHHHHHHQQTPYGPPH